MTQYEEWFEEYTRLRIVAQRRFKDYDKYLKLKELADSLFKEYDFDLDLQPAGGTHLLGALFTLSNGKKYDLSLVGHQQEYLDNPAKALHQIDKAIKLRKEREGI